MGIGTEQQLLCELLQQALTGKQADLQQAEKKADKKKLLSLAEAHKVLPFLYEELINHWQGIPFEEPEKKYIENISRKTVRQSYRLLFLTRFLVQLLEQEEIPVAVLKGSGVAALYPVPETRKAGDVDLLVSGGHLKQVEALFKAKGINVKENQHANHHLSFCTADEIDVELHTMLAEPFQNRHLNQRMEELLPVILETREYKDCMGVQLPVPAETYQALQLLLHILQHFLRAGFGLKLLCDWVVFWNRQTVQAKTAEFMALAESCGIGAFAETITDVCKKYLGLQQELSMGQQKNPALAEELLQDIFAAEEFGKADKNRMVIVQENHLAAYLREFHYQMKLNHPKTCRFVLLWPLLWLVTGIVFLRNNRKLNRGSVKSILQSAAKRSRLVQEMGLWEDEK